MATVSLYPAVDGEIQAGNDSTPMLFADICNAATALSVDKTSNYPGCQLWCGGGGTTADSWYYIIVPVFSCDSSVIGAGATITAADVNLYGVDKGNSDSVSPTFNLYGVALAAVNNIVVGDWDARDTTTPLSTAKTYAAMNVTGFAGLNTYALNADGLAAINPAGMFAVWVAMSPVVTKVAPSPHTNGFNLSCKFRICSTEEAGGTTHDFNVAVTYDPPVASGGGMFMVM